MPEADWHQTNKIKKKTLFSLHFYFCLQFPSTQEVTLYPVVRQNGAMRRKKRQQRRNLKKSLALIFKKEKLIISKIIGRGHYNYTQNTYTRPRKSNQNFYRLKALAGRNFMAPHVNFLFPLNLLHHHPLKMKVIKV